MHSTKTLKQHIVSTIPFTLTALNPHHTVPVHILTFNTVLVQYNTRIPAKTVKVRLLGILGVVDEDVVGNGRSAQVSAHQEDVILKE